MSAEEIVKTYSDTALAGIIRDLLRTRAWPDRLRAAMNEQRRRQSK